MSVVELLWQVIIIVNILVKQILYEYFKLQFAYIGKQYKVLKSIDYCLNYLMLNNCTV